MLAPMSVEVGFYGKLPSHGDFLRRRVPDAFVAVWDGWLQECLLASRDGAGRPLARRLLTSPAWRFVPAPGALGPQRHHRPDGAERGSRRPLLSSHVCRDAPRWRDRHRRGGERRDVPRSGRAAGGRDAGRRQHRLRSLRSRRPRSGWVTSSRSTRRRRRSSPRAPTPSWPTPSRAGASGSARSLAMGQMFRELCAQRLSALYDPCVIWWTEGSEFVRADLPDWERAATRRVVCRLARRRVVRATLAADFRGRARTRCRPPTRPRSTCRRRRSARPRSRTWDACARSIRIRFSTAADIGLWVVADGVGGLSQGEVASRMVCDVLADLVPGRRIRGGRATPSAERLSTVNDASRPGRRTRRESGAERQHRGRPAHAWHAVCRALGGG